MAVTAARTDPEAPATAVTLSALGTPFALIDGRRLRANIASMQAAVADLGAALRPHFKTHRALAIARLQREAGAIGFTTATVSQLTTVKAELGSPVLVSSLLQLDSAVEAPLRDALQAGGVMFAVESERSIELLRRALGPGSRAEVMIEIEAGCMRCGVPPAQCAALARVAAQQDFDVAGVFSYPGHSYIPGGSREASEQERAALDEAAALLTHGGFEVRHVSAGSTPSMPYARPGVATEYRPGTYVFGDRQQQGLGAVESSQLSLTVVATVIALHGDRIVLDAGGKALGRDAPRWLEGFGQLADSSEALITRLYDHHALIEGYHGERLAIGDRVAIVPNNVNSAMALARSVWISEDGETASELRPQPDR